jgi:CRISPR-associated protein Cas1
MVILPARSKSITVNVFPNVESHFKLRFAQYHAFFDEKLRLSLAQKVVAAKIEAQSKWLNHHNLCHDFSSALDEVQKAPNNASLMGIEGSVSKKYLELWRSLWDKSWNFHGRNRRPPLDPVNALLSLSYTIAGNAVGRWLSVYGLDLNLGFLHMPQRSRPSLALDALESIRPWIDQWLWLKVQEGTLTPKHFYNTNDHGCRLNKDGRAIFFPMWYDDAETWLELPRRDSLALILRTLRKYRYRTEE